MDWDTTWNCAAGKALDMEADVLYDPWDDEDFNQTFLCMPENSNLKIGIKVG